MASTRNCNTEGNYKVEQLQNKNIESYLGYDGFSTNINPAYFVRGSNPSIYSGQLSKNAIDVESMLRGIRATNLEGPSFKASPQIIKINETEYFKVNPIYMPQPYYHSISDRPLYLS